MVEEKKEAAVLQPQDDVLANMMNQLQTMQSNMENVSNEQIVSRSKQRIDELNAVEADVMERMIKIETEV